MGVLGMRSMKNADMQGKKIVLRVDFNVPLNDEGEIIDDTKMRAALPTIKYILGQNAAVIIMSHLGRPDGKPQVKYSLKNVAGHLQGLLAMPVIMAEDSIGPAVQEQVERLQPGNILLLENVRFYAEEEKNDPGHAKKLAAWGDIYINDAFGTAHRAHCSTSGIAEFLPSYAGFLLEKEVNMLSKVLESPQKPSMAILGGAKISDKLGLIDNFLEHMEYILIGGGMANTFIKALGYGIGSSLYDARFIGEANILMLKAQNAGVKLLLPSDVVIAGEVSAEAEASVVNIDEVPADMKILDIGPRTIEMFEAAIKQAKTIIWNGPLGVYEYSQFAQGTKQIAKVFAASDAVTIIGGGDSAAAVQDLGLEHDITHISTGGGAALEFLEGLQLPGVLACQNNVAATVQL
ncbi:MAG: phosphoglycerate kinase [Syntrophomonadaceae bacterium]|jgi:phosphoglycerate kinase|nr:phosphoglycerate kinase [Syntrophomonadaceae bacterium]